MNVHSARKTAFATAIAASLAAAPAFALEYQAERYRVQLDSKLSIGAAWRMSDRNLDYVGLGNGGRAYSTNGDDGNLAFDQGDIVSSAAKLTSDLTLAFGSEGNVGFFVRGSYLFNPTLDDHDFFDREDYGAGKEAPLSEYDTKTDAVRDYLGNDADLLDAYLFGNHSVAGRSLSYRIGKQVLNWGESALVQNGLNSILSFDLNQQRVPGFEIEELITPVGMVWASLELADNLNIEGFYQYDWHRTQPDAAGTFSSTNDFVGVGGTRANLGFGRANENTPASSIPRGPDATPEEGGQFGAALRRYLALWGGIDVGLYAANYHSRLPLVSGVSADVPQLPFGGSYFIEYPEDIQLYGLSFNSAGPFGFALQGEYSYKVDQPLQIDDVEVLLTGLGLPTQINPDLGAASGNQYIRGYRRHDVSQVDVSATRLFGPNPWLKADQTTLVLEMGLDYVHDLPAENQLRYDGPGTYTPGFDATTDGPFRQFLLTSQNLPAQTQGYATASSWGYKILLRLTYNNLIGPINVSPTLRFDHDVDGITPSPLNNFVEDRRLFSGSIGLSYLSAWSGEIGYTSYWGGGQQNLLQDRDFMEASIKYAF